MHCAVSGRTTIGGIAAPDPAVVHRNLTCPIVVANHGLGTANNGIVLTNTLPIGTGSRAGITRW